MPKKTTPEKRGGGKAAAEQETKRRQDWEGLRTKWIASPLSLSKFCRAEGVALGTAREHLPTVREKRAIQKKATATVDETDAKQEADQADAANLYVANLKTALRNVETVGSLAATAFKNQAETASRWSSVDAAGRLAIAAGETAVKLGAELQGVPDHSETFIWPLTKNFKPFTYQRDFILDDPHTIKAETGEDIFAFGFIGGVGSGKTYCGAQKAGALAEANRGKVGMILAPTYRMLEDSTKPTFFQVLAEKGISYRWIAKDDALILFGDTKILFRSMDNPERLRGPNLAWVWMDEGAQVKTRKAYDISLARIREPSAPMKCFIFTSTPDGLNWVYDIFISDAVENRAKVYRARTQDNPLLRDYYERLLAAYDTKFAQQELDARFLNVFAGAAYWNFDAVASVFDPKKSKVVYEPNRPLALMCDFNVAPMCWNVGQEVRTTDGRRYMYIIDELHIQTASTQEASEEFSRRYKGHKAEVEIYGDATGGHVRSTQASRSDYEIIRRQLKRDQFRTVLKIGKSNPEITDSIASANARLRDAKGGRYLYVSSACKHTVKDFERVGFKPGTRELEKGKGDETHHSDAIRYWAFRNYPIRWRQTIQRARSAARD